eukprot:tig00000949_g5743.t1
MDQESPYENLINQVASLLETAGRAVADLAQADSPNFSENFNRAVAQYYSTLKSIQAELRAAIPKHTDRRPFVRTADGAKAELKASHDRAKEVLELLQKSLAALEPPSGALPEPAPEPLADGPSRMSLS